MNETVTITEKDLGYYKNVRAIWNILIGCALNMHAITYGQVCRELCIDSNGHAIRHALGRIEKICKRKQLPLLNYLVVNMETHRPGGFVSDRTNEAAWRSQMLGVYAMDWGSVLFEDGEES